MIKKHKEVITVKVQLFPWAVPEIGAGRVGTAQVLHLRGGYKGVYLIKIH